jgi:DNA-binding NarL/FixJ family response regulator
VGFLTGFTPRHCEVLEMLVEGKSNKAMARALDLSEGTIKFHLWAVFRILGATNRVEAATSGSRLLDRERL